jgi:chromosome partitioning protein
LNLAAALHEQGKRILLIDADPQLSLSEALGIREESERNLFTEISKEMRGDDGDLRSAIIKTESGLEIIPSSIELAWAELELVSVYGREQVLKWMLEKLINGYDYIFIDCPPSVGMLTVNALVACDYILMPVQAEYLPLKSVKSFLYHFKALKKLNKDLEILGVVLTRYNEARIIDRHTMEQLEQDFGDKLFHTHIRNNCKLSNAQKAGVDIFHYDKRSHGAADYRSLAAEFEEKYSALKFGGTQINHLQNI